jgi:hypothetical protein
MVGVYTRTLTMSAAKTVSMSFRVSPTVGDNRSLTNMLETLVFAYCDKLGLKEPVAEVRKTKVARHA